MNDIKCWQLPEDYPETPYIVVFRDSKMKEVKETKTLFINSLRVEIRNYLQLTDGCVEIIDPDNISHYATMINNQVISN